MNVRAGLVTAPYEGVVATVEAREPGPGDVVIRTEFSFVSNGTERHTQLREFPDPPAAFPMAMGYQCVGRIERLGTAVREFAAGQLVFTRHNRLLGVSNPLGGVHAETIVASSDSLLAVPESVDPLSASALVIAQVGYNTAMRFPNAPGQAVLVLGDGLIGQFTAQVLVYRGFRVLLAGHHDSRLQAARAACPALHVANSSHETFEKQFQEFAGERVDLSVDSVGTPGTIDQCLRHTRPKGHVAVSGYQGRPQTLDVHRAFAGEYTVHFPAGATPERLRATLELIRQGVLQVAPLVTHHLEGAEFGQACRLLKAGGAECLGIALAWRRDLA